MLHVRGSVAICAGILVIAAGATMSSCRSTSEPPPVSGSATADAASPSEISGAYTLVSINGNALPYTMTHEPPGVRVTSGTFTISPDGTCSSRIAFVLPSGQAMDREVGATWTRDGATLTMTWQGAGMTTGTIEGATFTMDNEGQRFAYRRAP